MSEKFAKKLSKCMPGLSWPKGFIKAQKSFTIPKKLRKKQSTIQKAENGIDRRILDAETSYETVCATDSITSQEDFNFWSESEESISDGQDYSSIEVARSAGNFYSNSSFDVLVTQKSMVKDFSSDPYEFFRQNQPIALSTPIKNSDKAISRHLTEDPDLFFNCNKPLAASTPIKRRSSYHSDDSTFDSWVATSTPKAKHGSYVINHDEYKCFTCFENFMEEEEETITETPMISFISPSGGKDEEAANSDAEDMGNLSAILQIPILKNPEVSDTDAVGMTSNKNPFMNQEKSSVEDTLLKTLDIEYGLKETMVIMNPKCKHNSDSKIKKKKYVHKDKDLNLSVCCLTASPRHFKPFIKRPPKIDVIGYLPETELLEMKRLQEKALANVSVCCVGAVKCILPTLNMAVPTFSVKNTMQAVDRKTSARVQ